LNKKSDFEVVHFYVAFGLEIMLHVVGKLERNIKTLTSEEHNLTYGFKQ